MTGMSYVFVGKIVHLFKNYIFILSKILDRPKNRDVKKRVPSIRIT